MEEEEEEEEDEEGEEVTEEVKEGWAKALAAIRHRGAELVHDKSVNFFQQQPGPSLSSSSSKKNTGGILPLDPP